MDNKCPENYPVFNLRPAAAVRRLTPRQQRYAYYLSLAACAGQPILCEQICAEAAGVLGLLVAYVRPVVLDPGVLEPFARFEAVQRHFHEYVGQFFYQGCCYLGFGDTKFVPRCDAAALAAYLAELSGTGRFPGLLAAFEGVREFMYATERGHLGFAPSGRTWYFSDNIDRPTAERFNRFMAERGIMCENTRLELRGDTFVIHTASVERGQERLEGAFEGHPVLVERGMFSEHLARCCGWLRRAMECAEEGQREMLAELVAFYQTGDMARHLEYSRRWVRDTSPAVETYQAFIETYRDPTGVRAEYEAFVACVDPESSRQLEQLLEPETSRRILAALPIPAQLARRTFSPPTYKAIDIVVFTTSGLPIGINIPNYDSIRETLGFKNVSLQNVMATRETRLSEIQFVPEDVKPLLVRHGADILRAETAGHELFGHGSGSLVYREQYERLSERERGAAGITGCYEEGETFYARFGELQSVFEECRAEVTSFFLTFDATFCRVFGLTDPDVRLAATYSVLVAGVVSLVQYQEGRWLQAHSHARFAILRYVMERTDAVRIELLDGDLVAHVDAARLPEVRDAYAQMIRELNAIKASGDVGAGRALFARVGSVDGQFAAIRDVAVLRRRPRPVYLGALLRGGAVEDYAAGELHGLEAGIVAVANMMEAQAV